MKKLFSALLCLLGTSLLCSAFGATELATFKGFDANSLTQGTYTLNTNGNIIAEDGTITIGTAPLILTGSTTWDAASSGISVVMKYKNLDLNAGVDAALVTVSSAGTNSKLGCYVTPTNTVRGIWNTGKWGSEAGTNSVTIASSGYLVYVFNYADGDTNGTFVYDENGNVLYNASGLKGSGTLGVSVTLGGLYAGTLVATNLTVEGVAIYQNAFTSVDEVTAAVHDYAAVELTVDTSKSLSTIESEFGSAVYRTMIITNDVTVTVDQALSTDITVKGSGNLTLALEESTSISSYDISGFDFSNFEGSLVRSWVTDTVLGINFNSSNATNTTSAYASGTWIDTTGATGSSTNIISDGFTEVTWTSPNVWATSGSSSMSSSDSGNEFICGYLDDSTGVTITMSAVPFAKYDVIIYCATDTSSVEFSAKTVNGTTYTWSDTTGATVVGDSTWGSSSTTKETATAIYGVNTLRVSDLTGALTISSVKNGTARGCIAGIQIVSSEYTEPTLSAGGSGSESVTWSTAANWNVDAAPSSGPVSIVLSGDTTLTIDTTVSVGAVSVSGTGKLTIDVSSGASFTATSLQSAGAVAFASAVDIDVVSAAGGVYYDYLTDSIVSSANGSYYSAGAGSTDAAASVSLVGGTLGLTGGTFYYPASAMSGTATTIEMTNSAKIDLSASTDTSGKAFRVGSATYVLKDSASIETERFILSDGAASRTSIFTMSNNSSVVVTGYGYGSVNSTSSDIMFGHWAGPSTFTQEDSSTFTATNSDVLVGWTGSTQTINLNGGTMNVKGIKASGGTGSGTFALNLAGGTLILGETGIDSYYGNSVTIPVNVTASSTIGGTTETLPITQALTVGENATLSLTNAIATSEEETTTSTVTVTLTNTVSGAGTIAVGANVILSLDDGALTASPTIDLSDANSKLAVNLVNDAEDTVTLTITGTDVASRISVYSRSGDLIDSPSITSDNGVYTITSGMKVFSPGTGSDPVSLSSGGTWSGGTAATANEDFTIALTANTTLDIDTGLTYGYVYVTGSDTEQYTLTITNDFSATEIVLGDNVVLALDGTTTYSTAIGGTGAVSVPSTAAITISGTNDYTGGTTIAEGAVVTVGSTSPLGTGTVTGAGQVILTSIDYVPTGTASTPIGVSFSNTGWTGTVTLRGVSRDGALYFNTLVNTGSTLELDGVSGYFNNSYTASMKELKISKTTSVTFNSVTYYGFHINNGNGGNYAALTGALTGDGPITMSKTKSGNMPRFCLTLVGDATGWTGDVSMVDYAASSKANLFRLSFAASDSYRYTATSSSYDDYLAVSTNVTVSTWTLNTSDGKVDVVAPCDLNVTSSSAITAYSMTFSSTAQIKATDTTEASPATFTAALTINGDTTITGGHVKATSATAADGASIILGDLDSELILTTAADSGTVTSGVDGYVVRTKTVDAGTAYYLGRNGIRVYIR